MTFYFDLNNLFFAFHSVSHVLHMMWISSKATISSTQTVLFSNCHLLIQKILLTRDLNLWMSSLFKREALLYSDPLSNLNLKALHIWFKKKITMYYYLDLPYFFLFYNTLLIWHCTECLSVNFGMKFSLDCICIFKIVKVCSKFLPDPMIVLDLWLTPSNIWYISRLFFQYQFVSIHSNIEWFQDVPFLLHNGWFISLMHFILHQKHIVYEIKIPLFT